MKVVDPALHLPSSTAGIGKWISNVFFPSPRCSRQGTFSVALYSEYGGSEFGDHKGNRRSSIEGFRMGMVEGIEIFCMLLALVCCEVKPAQSGFL